MPSVQSPLDINHIGERLKALPSRRHLSVPRRGGRARFQADSMSVFVIWTFAARTPMS